MPKAYEGQLHGAPRRPLGRSPFEDEEITPFQCSGIVEDEA